MPSYEISVRGTGSPRLASAFEEMDVASSAGHTVLRGHVVDQAALYGLLDRVAALGLELVGLRRLQGAEAWDKAHPGEVPDEQAPS